MRFYERLGYEKDEFSPEPRVLRNGTVVEIDYVILSKGARRGSARKTNGKMSEES